MRKPCLEQRGFRRNLGVRGPDFLPPLLWSVYLVTRGGEMCGHRTRHQRRRSRGLGASICESWSLRSRTDPGCEGEGLVVDCECRPREGLCSTWRSRARGPAGRTPTPLAAVGPPVSLVSQNLERVFPLPPCPPPSTRLMLQSDLKSLNNKFDVHIQD